VQVSGEELELLSAQEEKLVSWRKCFCRLPSTPSLMPEPDRVTRMLKPLGWRLCMYLSYVI